MAKNINNGRLRKIVKILVAGTVIFGVSVLGFYVNFLRTENVHSKTAILANMILDAAQNLQKPLPIDAQSGRVYIYEGRLTLPAQGSDTQMSYRYDKPAQPDQYDEELNLTDLVTFRESRLPVMNAQNLNELFAAVPHLQACNRGYLLRFKPNYATETTPLLLTKKLKDGRMVYIYLEKECEQSKSRIEPYIKQIESY